MPAIVTAALVFDRNGAPNRIRTGVTALRARKFRSTSRIGTKSDADFISGIGRRDGATWWLREYRDHRLAKRRVGIADDDLDANGETIFSYGDLLKVALGGTRPTVTRSAAYTLR